MNWLWIGSLSLTHTHTHKHTNTPTPTHTHPHPPTHTHTPTHTYAQAQAHTHKILQFIFPTEEKLCLTFEKKINLFWGKKIWAQKFYQIKKKNPFLIYWWVQNWIAQKYWIDDTVPILKYLINWFVCGLFKKNVSISALQ